MGDKERLGDMFSDALGHLEWASSARSLSFTARLEQHDAIARVRNGSSRAVTGSKIRSLRVSAALGFE